MGQQADEFSCQTFNIPAVLLIVFNSYTLNDMKVSHCLLELVANWTGRSVRHSNPRKDALEPRIVTLFLPKIHPAASNPLKKERSQPQI